jgi:hypothetical protein
MLGFNRKIERILICLGGFANRFICSEKNFGLKHWLLCTGLIVFLWTFALLHIQSESFRSGYQHGWVFQKFLVRAVLDILFTASLILLLPRVLAWVPILLSMIGGLGLIVYAQYFNETMSVLSLWGNFSEGTAVLHAIFSLIPLESLFLFLFLFLLCGILLFLRGLPPMLYRFRLAGAGGLLCAYLGIIVGVAQFNDLAFRMLIFEKETGDLTIIYGYLPVWTAELCIKNETALRQSALRQPRTNQLSPLETPLPLPRQLVVVQVESLDFTIIDKELNGKIVTPFLNELKTKSFFYKVNTFHYHGSSDADFSFLARREPSQHLLNYKIKTYPYNDALPHHLNNHGYKTYSFHNGNRLFFSRYPVFHKMGFSEIYFIEDLAALYHLETEMISGWRSVPDDVLFRLVSNTVNSEQQQSFFFVITLFSHTPFTAITEKGIFPNPTNPVHFYANSIHVLDRQFQTFYESLPAGTLLVVYGDHSSNLNNSEYISRDSNNDYSPCLISIVGNSIAHQQKTDPTFALSGQLSLVDIANYIQNLAK